MVIKMDKWYKRLFTRLMWKLRIWKLPRYGNGVYAEKGIQVQYFDKEPQDYSLKAAYSEQVQKAVDNQKFEITNEFIDNIADYREQKGMKYNTKMRIPFAFKCLDSVKMYALTRGIEIVNIDH